MPFYDVTWEMNERWMVHAGSADAARQAARGVDLERPLIAVTPAHCPAGCVHAMLDAVVIDGEMMSPKDAAEYQDHQKDVEETDR